MNITEKHTVDGIPFKLSPNHGSHFSAGQPDAIIIHYTAGLSAESSASWLCNPASKASAHVVIGRSGSITQIVPFNTVAWHAGKSSFGGRSGYNQFSIGIELDNPGRLSRTEGGGFLGLGRSFPADEVIQAVHRNESSPSYWLSYPDAQIAAAFNLCQALCEKYKNIHEILGHEEIAPGRKSDPGPAFPLDHFRSRLIDRDRSEDGAAQPAPKSVPSLGTEGALVTRLGIVTASKLNIRSAPSVTAALVARPLSRGTVINLLGGQPASGWLRASVRDQQGISGWVKADYVRT